MHMSLRQPCSNELVATGSKHRRDLVRPTTSRALVLRNGKYGAMGAGELVAALRKKLSGKEKLDLLAEDLVQRAILPPFRLEHCLDIASSQCDAYLDNIANLKDPALFCDLVKAELVARCPLDSQQRLNAFQNPSYIASVIATRIHNVYMFAAGWRLVRDTLAHFEANGLTDNNVTIKLKNNPQLRLRYLHLYDMVDFLVNMSQSNFSVLATTTPHYACYFKKVDGAAPDEPDMRFDWNGLREACLSFTDSIIIELCFPRAPYPRDILFSILRDVVEEAPKEAKHFPQALWDAVGDFSASVELHSLLEAVLLGPDGSAWRNTPRSMPEEYGAWADAQLYSVNASDVCGNWKDLIYPLEKTKEQPVLDEMWRQINLNYKSMSGKGVDMLWGLSDALDIAPQWHSFYIPYPIGEPDSDDEVKGRKALTLTRKRQVPVEEGSDDSTPRSMPSLQTVSGSEHGDEDFEDFFEEYADDESGYDTGEEEELRDMARTAMDVAHEIDFYDAADLNSDLDPLSQRDDCSDNPFIKLLGSLRGRLFSSNPKLKAGEHFRKTSIVSADKGQKVALEEIEEEEDEGKDETSQVQKKKKKKKKSRKKASTAASPDQVQASPSVGRQESIQAAPLPQTEPHTQPTPGTKSSAAPKKVTPPKVIPAQLSAASLSTTSLSAPIEATIAQSARSYMRSERLDVQKNKVKSRSDQASIFSSDAKDKKGMFARFRLGHVKDISQEEQNRAKESWFSKLSKRATKCMHQLLRTSQDRKQGLAPMKWDHFVALMVEMGFTYDPTTAGSSVRFYPPDKRDRPITIHKPHPDPTLQPIMLREIASRLKRYYGWNEEDFLAQAR